VEEKCSRSIVELLKRFEGPDPDGSSSEWKVNTHVCTGIAQYFDCVEVSAAGDFTRVQWHGLILNRRLKKLLLMRTLHTCALIATENIGNRDFTRVHSAENIRG
jgi:hypothetical protein